MNVRLSPQRVVAWFGLVAAMAALAYGSNFAESGDPPPDILFRWSTAVSAAVLYAIVLALVLAIASSVDRSVLGLVRPRSWASAAGWSVVGFVAVSAVGLMLDAAGLKAGDEQGLVPDGWDSTRAAPFLANFVVIAIFAPVVEELAFRGLGFSAMCQLLSAPLAVVATAVAFGLAHGLVVAFPVLAFFGVVLAVLRLKTGSVYPPMILHGIFNAVALIAGVAGAGS